MWSNVSADPRATAIEGFSSMESLEQIEFRRSRQAFFLRVGLCLCLCQGSPDLRGALVRDFSSAWLLWQIEFRRST